MSETLEETIAKEKGWKPIPLPLKILFVVFILWLVGSVVNLPNLFENGLPLFGNFVYGMTAALVVLLLDIIGPVTFLYALWNRKSWTAKWAFAYIGIFILNSTVALFTVREKLGLPQILVPTIASLIFLAVIFWKRNYFKQTP
ncbi:MAG: hypothetical protein GY935_10660 [Gammaproteobacteria bacterium]|nr:hypothetical protein [Gammaproteobacteria bacterium]